MRTIELDATKWKTALDFYHAKGALAKARTDDQSRRGGDVEVALEIDC